jgi:hypothetical protein
MPGAGHLRTAADGGHLKGGAPRVVWQALGADPAVISARSAAERLTEFGRAGHLIWNPLYGEIVQMVSVLRSGRLLGGPEGLAQLKPGCAADSGARPASAEPAQPDWLPEVNSEGRLCVQVCVVANAWDPFTAGPMKGLQDILDWLDSWGIPRRWPAGAPVAYRPEQAAVGHRRSLRCVAGPGLDGRRAGRDRHRPADRPPGPSAHPAAGRPLRARAAPAAAWRPGRGPARAGRAGAPRRAAWRADRASGLRRYLRASRAGRRIAHPGGLTPGSLVTICLSTWQARLT